MATPPDKQIESSVLKTLQQSQFTEETIQSWKRFLQSILESNNKLDLLNRIMIKAVKKNKNNALIKFLIPRKIFRSSVYGEGGSVIDLKSLLGTSKFKRQCRRYIQSDIHAPQPIIITKVDYYTILNNPFIIGIIINNKNVTAFEKMRELKSSLEYKYPDTNITATVKSLFQEMHKLLSTITDEKVLLIAYQNWMRVLKWILQTYPDKLPLFRKTLHEFIKRSTPLDELWLSMILPEASYPSVYKKQPLGLFSFYKNNQSDPFLQDVKKHLSQWNKTIKPNQQSLCKQINQHLAKYKIDSSDKSCRQIIDQVCTIHNCDANHVQKAVMKYAKQVHPTQTTNVAYLFQQLTQQDDKTDEPYLNQLWKFDEYWNLDAKIFTGDHLKDAQTFFRRKFSDIKKTTQKTNWFWGKQKQKQQLTNFSMKKLSDADKNSSSLSIVYRGQYMGRTVFVKSFYCGFFKELANKLSPQANKKLSKSISEDQITSLSIWPNRNESEDRLLYEKCVYQYLRAVMDGSKQPGLPQLTTKERDDIRQHFIYVLRTAIDVPSGYAFMFTQDTNGMSMADVCDKVDTFMNTDNNNFVLLGKEISRDKIIPLVLKIMFQALYVNYLLHEKLMIVHNDMHIGNIIVVPDDMPRKEYIMRGKKYIVEDHPFHIYVYDFDLSSIYFSSSLTNPFLKDMCNEYGKCKRDPRTDLFIWLASMLVSPSVLELLSSYDSQIKTNADSMEKSLITICPQLKRLLSSARTGFWSSYCITTKINILQTTCTLPKADNFNLDLLLVHYMQFLKNVHVDTISQQSITKK